MASNEERLKILKMIDDGKITAEEGAKLLGTLSENRKPAPRPTLRANPSGARWLKIRVSDTVTGKSKATVIAFDELIQSINEGALGKIIDVEDDEDGEHVEIYIE
jgi:hypothetical protein